jgi:hypothetical protein
VNVGEGHPTVRQTVKQLLKEEGWRGFYKGIGPRFLSMSLWGTSMITTYEFLSKPPVPFYVFFLVVSFLLPHIRVLGLVSDVHCHYTQKSSIANCCMGSV